jgi:peptidoglycan/LPS O-acetylase OafA/YrhL
MIPGLDGLRGIAFLLIFFVHTDYINFGWAGVQLFFVLSGFLITGILVDMKRSVPGGQFFLKFYGRRMLRIFPLYYFYLALAVVLSILLFNLGALTKKMDVFWEHLPYALTFTYNFFYVVAKEPSMLLSHFWTLSVEEQFYVIWPLLIFLTPEKHFKKLFLGAIAFGLLFRLGFTLVYEVHPMTFVVNGVAHGLYPLTFSHMDAFGMGALLSQFKFPKSTKQFAVLSVVLPIIGFTANYLSTGSIGPWHGLGFQYLMDNAYQFIWGYSLLNYWFAVAIDAVAREGMFQRVLASKPLTYLGKISYGLYVYHLGVIFLIYRLLGPQINLPNPVTKFLLMLLEFAATFAVASLSYRYLERPILNLKDKYFPLPKEARGE